MLLGTHSLGINKFNGCHFLIGIVFGVLTFALNKNLFYVRVIDFYYVSSYLYSLFNEVYEILLRFLGKTFLQSIF
ncbi:hypothetical protein DLM75_07615 [Leptospira stimsonii]|uniref:Uncharacterized protein n=1 Tax=Leptospira stimsonii TaxID=2202203 RepID=A0A396ZBZ0_9LEPT|nr:hypothetical protein DLM75_07615 [Leptospira stimsonii]